MRFSKYDNMFQSKAYNMIAINEKKFYNDDRHSPKGYELTHFKHQCLHLSILNQTLNLSLLYKCYITDHIIEHFRLDLSGILLKVSDTKSLRRCSSNFQASL